MTPTPVFLISLPRSGSTYLQRLLNSSQSIATHAEPWVALPLVSALRGELPLLSPYGHRLAKRGLRDVEESVSGSINRAIAAALESIYTELCNGLPIFVDKTPRNNLIWAQLAEILPAAKFIVLSRNPRDVLVSLSETFLKGSMRIEPFRVDLTHGLMSMKAALERCEFDCRFLHVKYDELGSSKLVPRLESFLGVQDISESKLKKHLRGSLGDPAQMKPVEAETRNEFRTSTVRSYWWSRHCKRFLPSGYLELIGVSPEEVGLARPRHEVRDLRQSAVDLFDIVVRSPIARTSARSLVKSRQNMPYPRTKFF